MLLFYPIDCIYEPNHQLGSKTVTENGVLTSPSGTLDSLRTSYPLSRTNIRPNSRRSILHHSTNSLVSEDPSSKSTSPVPSPMPTQNLLRSQPQSGMFTCFCTTNNI